MPIRLLPADARALLSALTVRPRALLQLDRRASSGQSMTEYLIALVVLVAVIAGAGAGNPSMLQVFLDSLRTGWTRLLMALALPI